MPHRDSRRRAATLLLQALAAFGAAAPAIAQRLFVSAGTEVDAESGQLLFAAVGGNFAEHTTWDFFTGHADTSRDFSSVTTTSYDAGIRHDFGKVGLRIGVGGWRDSELVATEKIVAALELRGDAWSFALQGELRDSAFEPFDIDRTIVRRDGTEVTITARADCGLDDNGWGAQLRWSNRSWSWALNGMSYDYDEPACAFSSPALSSLRRATRAEFVQFADRVATALSYTAGTQLLAETSFLDSRLGTSVSYRPRARTYRVSYDRFEEALFGFDSATLSAGVSFPVGVAYELEVYAGVTESDAFSDIGFLGFTFVFSHR